jgi:hypothetical protein
MAFRGWTYTEKKNDKKAKKKQPKSQDKTKKERALSSPSLNILGIQYVRMYVCVLFDISWFIPVQEKYTKD